MFLLGAMDQQVVHYSDKFGLLIQIIKDQGYIVHPDLGGTRDPHREYLVTIYGTPKVREDSTKFLAALGQGNAMVRILQSQQVRHSHFEFPRIFKTSVMRGIEVLRRSMRMLRRRKSTTGCLSLVSFLVMSMTGEV